MQTWGERRETHNTRERDTTRRGPRGARPNVCASARHRFARPSAATIVDGNVCAGSAGPARRPVAFTFADAPMPKPCDAGGGAETQTSRSPIRPAPHDHLFRPTRQIRGALLSCGTGGNGGGGGAPGGIRRELFMNGGPNSGSEPSNLLGLD